MDRQLRIFPAVLLVFLAAFIGKPSAAIADACSSDKAVIEPALDTRDVDQLYARQIESKDYGEKLRLACQVAKLTLSQMIKIIPLLQRVEKSCGESWKKKCDSACVKKELPLQRDRVSTLCRDARQ